MRRLTWLPTGLALAPLLAGCTQLNPAFDECPGPNCIAEDSGSSGETGDGDPGDGDPGDGDPGDGDPGDGDGDPDPLLPQCPDGAEFELPLIEDTFLDGTGVNNGTDACLVTWDYFGQNHSYAQLPCAGLDFGGLDMHWVCGSDICNSSWLGRFDVEGFGDIPGLTVKSAAFVFTAKIFSPETAQASLYELDVDSTVFGECLEWMAGGGWGQEPADCVTTYAHAAFPHLWNDLSPLNPDLNSALNSVYAPISPQAPDYHSFPIEVAPAVVEGWMLGDTDHEGVLLRTNAWQFVEFNLLAQGSESPPQLLVSLCSEAP